MRETLAERRVPSWAVTKLRSPKPRDEIQARPRLSRIFDEALDAREPLVLVSAPAGSGKSTAVATWAASRADRPTAWMQIDAGDNDPVRFWTALVSGLAAIEPRIQAIVQPLLATPKVDFATGVLPALVNALDEASNMIIVLDDYHLIESEAVHDALALLIDALPDDVTVVVATRHDPPLHLGRLRVRGQLREIRVADLRFNPDEAATILTDATLSSVDIQTLCERTEGWAAGLVLASVSLAQSVDPDAFIANFAGDNRLVFDYLSTELWDVLDEQVQQFFLDISVVDKMCGELVDAMLGSEAQGAIRLDRASRDNQLIISLDDHGGWYRFHHLLQEQLQSRLQQADPQRYQHLHSKAARWFAQHDEPEAAIRHALAAGDTAAAAKFIGMHGSATFSQGQLVTVRKWLAALDPALIDGNPQLAVLRVWTLIIGAQWDLVEGPIQTAQRVLDNASASPNLAMLRGSLVTARSLAAIANGEIGHSLELVEGVLARTEQYEITSLVRGIHGVCLTWHGLVEPATVALEAAVSAAASQQQHLIEATSLAFLAINACARSDSGQARHLATQAIERAEEHGLSEYHHVALAHSVLGRTMVAHDAALAHQAAERGLALARRSNQSVLMAFALISHAEIQIAARESDRAKTLLIEARNLLGRCEDPGMVLTFLARTEARLGARSKDNGSGPLDTAPDGLTAREVTVVRLLPSKLSVREIAAELSVTRNTVKGHLKAIYRKLGVHDRQAAVQRARELRLL